MTEYLILLFIAFAVGYTSAQIICSLLEGIAVFCRWFVDTWRERFDPHEDDIEEDDPLREKIVRGLRDVGY
ncbi:MAG: hypothetical protein ACWGQW_00015 [bacterium]